MLRAMARIAPPRPATPHLTTNFSLEQFQNYVSNKILKTCEAARIAVRASQIRGEAVRS
jgi:hypothetical protein